MAGHHAGSGEPVFAKYSDILETAIGAVAEEMSNDLRLLPEEPPEGPTTNISPPVPPIEEKEHIPRRRKKSNLRYLEQHVTEDGVDWLETIAIARPGYKIKCVRRQTSAGHPARWHIHTESMRRRRRRKANGKINGATNGDV
jgi:hypothetical protein